MESLDLEMRLDQQPGTSGTTVGVGDGEEGVPVGDHKSTRLFLVGGGLVAALFLLVVGIGSIVMGMQGRADVRDRLAAENLVGPDDSTIPGEVVDTGAEAKAFADIMREHALAAADGLTYSQLQRYVDPNGAPTNDREAAAKNAAGQPVENPARTTWITETALSTALNTAFFAEQVANFAILMGVALALSGIGFVVLVFGVFRHQQATSAASGGN